MTLVTCATCPDTWTAGGAAHCSRCHRLFSTPSMFDKHRSQYGERGACLDPETVVDNKGERVLFLRDGMWRGPEMTAAQKAARFGNVA